MTRPRALQDFLNSLRDGFETMEAGEAARLCVERVFAALEIPRAARPKERVSLPACDHLDEALERARQGGASLARIAATFTAIEPDLSWSRRPSDETASSNFSDGHANAMIVGPKGLETRDDAWIGVSLLAPHVRYPDHSHAPEEVYLVLSPGKFRHGTEDWCEPGTGGFFYNTPHIRHAMASGDAPFFAIWCLAPAQP